MKLKCFWCFQLFPSWEIDKHEAACYAKKQPAPPQPAGPASKETPR